MKKKTILVTGGAGFIASHIVDAYIGLGHKVIIVDNLSTGDTKNINANAVFYKADIRDRTAIEKIFQKEKPEIVNHHAAIAEVVKSLKDPIPTIETNVIGTINLLMIGKDNGMKKFIFASTGGAIYGEPEKIPANEKTPAAPLSPYGLSKLQGEEAITCYAHNFGFDYLIFRYPNVYGPRQNPKGEAGVVAIFGGLIVSRQSPTIFGDGTKSRDYVYVDDLVRANIIALTNNSNDIFNLGWGIGTSDKEVFDSLTEAIGIYDIHLIYAKYRKGEVYKISLDAKKAKNILNWQPKIKFKQGVKKYIETTYPNL